MIRKLEAFEYDDAASRLLRGDVNKCLGFRSTIMVFRKPGHSETCQVASPE